MKRVQPNTWMNVEQTCRLQDIWNHLQVIPLQQKRVNEHTLWKIYGWSLIYTDIGVSTRTLSLKIKTRKIEHGLTEAVHHGRHEFHRIRVVNSLSKHTNEQKAITTGLEGWGIRIQSFYNILYKLFSFQQNIMGHAKEQSLSHILGKQAVENAFEEFRCSTYKTKISKQLFYMIIGNHF